MIIETLDDGLSSVVVTKRGRRLGGTTWKMGSRVTETSPSGCLTPFPRGRIRPVVGPSLFMLNMEYKMLLLSFTAIRTVDMTSAGRARMVACIRVDLYQMFLTTEGKISSNILEFYINYFLSYHSPNYPPGDSTRKLGDF